MKLPGTQKRVHSWNELLAELHARKMVPHRPDEGGHFRSPYVFRGADCSDWPLKTSLVRLRGLDAKNATKLERSMIRTFRKYANAGAFDDKSEWYVLAVAQHNGLPTRCLDWAASPLVAAHFACADEARKSDHGVVWCLDAGALRELTHQTRKPVPSLKGIAWVYDTHLLETRFKNLDGLDATLKKRNKDSHVMLLWEPPSLDARIANQSGLLSIMNSATGSQNDFLLRHAAQRPSLVHRIVIDAAAKPEIRDMLDQNNISERTLFPGLPGLCAWLKRYYGASW